MPEIKNVFNQGKMNKDLDERLVPKGEYRHALNIQVSSSEGSDVGTVQNILGNSKISSFIGLNPVCVGAIADEKTNALYWFVKTQYYDAILEYKNKALGFVLVDVKKNVLKFTGNIITGINIIDNLLFFTDNSNEPKKINIDLCKLGTDPVGYIHTKLVVPKRNISIADNIDIREEHITVIKKSPKQALSLTTSNLNVVSAFKQFAFQKDNVNEAYSVGEVFVIEGVTFNDDSKFKVGDTLLFLPSSSIESLPDSFSFSAEVLADLSGKPRISPPGTQPVNTYSLKVLSVVENVETDIKIYNIQLSESRQKFFEDKFVRFSYRYKYQDGEYSCYAPFSPIAFEPNSLGFDYNTKKAYNTAMENTLVKLTLENFIEEDMLENVVEVEILYKESNSPLIYSVDKITKTDANVTQYSDSGVLYSSNYWDANKYEIKSDIIYAVLPENQLVRPFDNVPRKALSQEITGNRLVYGNYEQNYDIKDVAENYYKPIISSWYGERYSASDFQTGDKTPQKSLKSLRQYQVGVVYTDHYGRETPVFANTLSSFSVPKSQANKYNKVVASFNTEHPSWAKGFKFYVKESSNDYYNLAMDRIYEAEDGNLWLSFPSSERNKVDDETFLILKKSIDNNILVSEEAKYKVIAISNEAPEFIKTIKKEVCVTPGNTTSSNTFTNPVTGDPVPIALFFDGNETPQTNSRSFSINKTNWLTAISDIELPDLNKLEKPLSITFSETGSSKVTKEYKISSLTTNANDTKYNIVLEERFDEADEWIYPDLVNPATINSNANNTSETGLSPTLEITIHEFTIENKPEFEGKFFVKIFNDETAQQNLVIPALKVRKYETLASSQVYYFSDTSATGSRNNGPAIGTTNSYPTGPNIVDKNVGDTTGGGYNFLDYDPVYSSYTLNSQPFLDNSPDYGNPIATNTDNNIDEWQNVLNPTKSDAPEGHWFIDQVYYRGQAPLKFFDSEYDRDSGSHVTTTSDLHGITKESSYSRGTKMGFSWLPAVIDSVTKALHDTNYKQGIYTENGQEYIELSFSKLNRHELANVKPSESEVEEDLQVYFKPSTIYNNNHTFRGIYNDKIWMPPKSQDRFVNALRSGTIFQFEGDANNQHYKIVGNPKIEKRYNHTNAFDFAYALRKPFAFFNQTIYGDVSTVNDFIRSDNRRITYKIPIRPINIETGQLLEQIDDHSVLVLSDFSDNNSQTSILNAINAETPIRLTFLKQQTGESASLTTNNPAIWETAPKENIDLDIYYEASSIYPTTLDTDNLKTTIQEGMRVECEVTGVIPFDFSGNFVFVKNVSANGIQISSPIRDELLYEGARFIFSNNDGASVVLSFKEFQAQNIVTDPNDPNILVSDVLIFDSFANEYALDWSNCYSFGNGVESNRIRDDFNQTVIDKGVKASAPIEGTYEKETRTNGLIYSGIYNSTSGVNNLNQFIAAEKITKDLNPTYGSIQKLFSRNTDLIAFCEDRVIKILANKDAVFNADGNPNLVATPNVLGQSIPFTGDYGISQNPESFAKENFRAYFTDKARGAILRLSMDGLTAISEYGMSDYFSDNLKLNDVLLGSYDGDKNEYNLTLQDTNTTVSYSEKVKGWTSFKSFVPEQSLSMSNDYYTFKNGHLYQHHVEVDNSQNTVPRNNFYDEQHISSVEVLLNDAPESVKNFKTLNYEGSDSRVISETTNVSSGYHNLQDKPGWFSTYVKTNKNEGYISEFVKKEGKWFNFIKGNDFITNEDINTELFTYQGLGKAIGVAVDENLYIVTTPSPPPPPPIPDPGVIGCMDPNALNYNPLAVTDDSQSCVYPPPPPPPPPPPLPVFGCTNPTAVNYNPNATVDDGSCALPALTIQDTNDND